MKTDPVLIRLKEHIVVSDASPLMHLKSYQFITIVLQTSGTQDDTKILTAI